MATEHNNNEDMYVYHTPSTSYDYPNKPYEPFPGKRPDTPSKNKKHKVILGVSIGLILLCLGLFLSYLCIPSVKRFVYRNLLSTDKYYFYIESNNIKDMVSSLDNMSDEKGIIRSKNNTLKTSLKGSVDVDLDSSLWGVESNKHYYGLGFTYEPNQDTSHINISCSAEHTDLLSFDYFENETQCILRFPELSSTSIDITPLLQYLGSVPDDLGLTESPSSSSVTSSYLNNQELISSMLQAIDDQTIIDLVDRYGSSFVDAISKYSTIDLEENTSLHLTDYMHESIKQSDSFNLTCDKFTITLTEDNTIDVIQELLALVRTDSNIEALVKAAGVDPFYFTTTLSYVQYALESLKTGSTDSLIMMDVYVKGDNVVFRDIKIKNKDPYQIILSNYTDKDVSFYYLSLGDTEAATKDFSLCINSTSGTNGANGKGYISIADVNMLITFSDIEGYSDYYALLPTGNLMIQVEDDSSDGWNDIALTYLCTKENGKQQASLKIGNEQFAFINTSFTFEAFESKGFSFPDQSTNMISAMDYEQMKDYLNHASYDSLLNALSSSLSINMDRTELIDGILSILNNAVYSNDQ